MKVGQDQVAEAPGADNIDELRRLAEPQEKIIRANVSSLPRFAG